RSPRRPPATAPTTMPTGPPAAAPITAPLVKPAPARLEPEFESLAIAGLTARLIANTPATNAGLRNFVVQVPMCPLQLLEPESGLALEGHFNRGSGSPPGDSGAIRRRIVAKSGTLRVCWETGTGLGGRTCGRPMY